MQSNILGQSGGSSTGLNVFAQLQEPSKKEGIWIKTEETVIDENTTLPAIQKYKYNEIELTTKNMFSKLSTPQYNTKYGSSVRIRTDVYIFGGYNGTTSHNHAYKYDTLTGRYTPLTDIPFSFSNGSAVAIGTDIYLLGGSGDRKRNYKYNALTDTYTPLTDIPYRFSYGSAVAIGTDIYLLGGNDEPNNNYKYDTIAGTYTPLNNIPFEFHYGSAVLIENDIYLITCDNASSSGVLYKYNITADTYTQFTNTPQNFTTFSRPAVAIDTDIYIFATENGSSTFKSNYIYKFDTLKSSFTLVEKWTLSDLLYDFIGYSAIAIGTVIYLFGDNAYKYGTTKFKNKNVYIETAPFFKVNINKKILTYISNAKIYDDNEFKNYPCYYGDGEKWNLIA